MKKIVVDIGLDFSVYPGGRYKDDGKFSGEEFRENFLVGPIEEGKEIEVRLDRAAGFTTSFLEEAFGGLVRKFGKDVINKVTIIADSYPNRGEKVRRLMEEASK